MSTATKPSSPLASSGVELHEKTGEALQNERKQIEAEIQKVKAQGVEKKLDENTRIFNLRQLEMTNKIKELEVKKMRTENELKKIMEMKNSTLHDDLKKISLHLVNETKKIAPLEQNIASGMSKIHNLKNEMQLIFEASLNERNKNSKILEDQTKELNSMSTLIKSTMETLETNYAKTTTELEKLMQEKILLVKKNSQLQEEINSKESVLKDLGKKQDKVSELETVLKSLEDKISELNREKNQYDHLREDTVKLHEQYTDLKRSIESAQTEHNDCLHNTSRLELSYKQLEEQFKSKQESMHLLEKEYADGKKRLENLKNDEISLMRNYQNEMSTLGHIKAEYAQIEAMKTTAQEFQKAAEESFLEKKEFFKREFELLEREYKLKCTEIETTHEQKKLQWETEFKTYSEAQKTKLKEDLDFMNNDDLTKIKDRRSEFVKDVLEIMKNQFKQEGFISSDERIENAKNEAEAAFERFFGKTKRWMF